MKKVVGVTILAGLLNGAYSRVRSHYRPTRALLAARFPSLPDSHFLRQPGYSGLLHHIHVDARLSADTSSTTTSLPEAGLQKCATLPASTAPKMDIFILHVFQKCWYSKKIDLSPPARRTTFSRQRTYGKINE